MEIKMLSPFISVSPQLRPEDIGVAAGRGFKAIINNRPDGENDDQCPARDIEAAARGAGLDYRHIPVVAGQLDDAGIADFQKAMDQLGGPVLAFCRTGRRSVMLWAMCEARHLDAGVIIGACSEAGYDLSSIRGRLESRATEGAREGGAFAGRGRGEVVAHVRSHEEVVLGGGAAGIATDASLSRQRAGLEVVVEPSEWHCSQSGRTIDGGW